MSKLSLSVLGLVTTMMLTGPAHARGTEDVQFSLSGLFATGELNLSDTILGSRAYTAPERRTLLIKYVTCRATVSTDQSVHITLNADFEFEGTVSPTDIVAMIPENGFSFDGRTITRRVGTESTHAFVNIDVSDGPSVGDTVTLRAQKANTIGTGGVECVVSGKLFRKARG